MLQLNAEQGAALQAIKRERDIRALSDALAAAFPEAAARVGERYAALIEHGVQRGAAHGLDHAVCVARYMACWFVLGAEFESRPGFEWARDLLAAPGRPQGGKVFQLCRRTREETAAQRNAAVTPAAFDQAIALLDSTLMPLGTLGSLLPTPRLQLGEACDIDALDLRPLESARGSAAQAYRLQDKQWRRLPAGTARAPVTLAASTQTSQPAPALPPRLHLLSQPAERDYTRLRLRTRATHCCDPQVHPLVTLNGPQGLGHWRGPLSADITLNLYADATPPALDDGPQPAIAVETSPNISLLGLGSCGMRESGQPLGDQQTQISVYPAEQQLMTWQREPGAAMSWPEPPGGQPTAPPARCRIERDGLPLDSSRWLAGLEDLDRQLAEGLSRLATAWERESGVRQGRMAAEPSVLAGTAGITWGWADAGSDMATAPYYRVAGALDLVACQLKLRLGGELALHGSLSRLALHCSGRQDLRAAFERKAEDTDLPAAVGPALVSFRHPFVLQIQTMVQADSHAMLDAAGPVGGALVGSCGLRPRPAGGGLQWFCCLAIEAVSVSLLLHDPLLGGRALVRPLLPAMKLLDWSLG